MKPVTKESALLSYLQPKCPLRFRPDGSYKILCFSDLHETRDYDPRSLAAMDGIIEAEHPDLVLLGGDIWNGGVGGTPGDLTEFLNIFTAPMESRGIPWAHVFGNHDHDVTFDEAVMQEIFEGYPHCVSDHTGEGVDGTTNFLLPVLDSRGEHVAFAVWGLDTHNLSDKLLLRNGVNLRVAHRVAHRITGTSHWDFVHFNQIRWYYDTSEALEAYNGSPVDALMMLHAAPLEFGICMDNPEDTHLDGDVGESFESGSLNSGIVAAALERGDVRAMVCGHMHTNTFAADYCGMKLCFDGSIGFRTGGRDEWRSARVFELSEADTAHPRTRLVYARDVLK